MNNNHIKHSGQVYTPEYLAELILDEARYSGETILNRHIIDNSCGDGVFLTAIIRRYITAYLNKHKTLSGIEKDIETYIHGIEIDPVAYECCIENLKDICRQSGIDNLPNFDILNSDTLTITKFNDKMDFVIGNPPYVRVHNLYNYFSVKSYSFAVGGMTDLYLVFFELGFNMLKKGGKLCYITPSSWINSLAGANLRSYIKTTKSLKSVIDLEHYQAFNNATTYTMISLFQKGEMFDTFSYNKYNPETSSKEFIENLTVDEININGYFYFGTHNAISNLKNILTANTPKYVTVKNGFATLADKIFIQDSFPFDEYTIPVIKASTGKWYKAFFPYDENGKPVDKNTIFSNPSIAKYLNENKIKLLKGEDEINCPNWYLFGRTQALKDVYTDKLSINTVIIDIKSIKLNTVPKGSGIYSGLYILTQCDFDVIRSIINTEEFISYIVSLKKYKSGGYYTFNSKDLEMYLNYNIQKLIVKGLLNRDDLTNY